MIKASSFKNWCIENISPQSWSRICLKRLDDIHKKGFTLKEIEELNSDIELDDELVTNLNEALLELYEMKAEIN